MVRMSSFQGQRKHDRGEGGRADKENWDDNSYGKNNSSDSASGAGAGDRKNHGSFTTMNIAGKKFPYFDHDECDDACFMKPKPMLMDRTTVPKNLTHSLEISQRNIPAVSSYPNWSLEDLLECVICRDIFIEATITGCGHTFCSNCIREWLRKKRWCPICQEPVKLRLRNLIVDRMVEHMLPKLPTHCQNRFEAMRSTRLCKLKRILSKPKTMKKTFLGRCMVWLGSFLQSMSLGLRRLRNKGILHVIRQRCRSMARFYVEDIDDDDSGCEHVVKIPSVNLISPLGLICIGIFLGWLFTSTRLWSVIYHTAQMALSSIGYEDEQKTAGCLSECRRSRSY